MNKITLGCIIIYIAFFFPLLAMFSKNSKNRVSGLWITIKAGLLAVLLGSAMVGIIFKIFAK